jgi:chromosome segregation ATPase
MSLMKSTQLRALIDQYKLRLEDYPPYEKDGKLYFRRTDTDQEILYLRATCDELRHGLTNYEQLLGEIKTHNFDHASAKDAIIYAIKYEATRKVYHTQRQQLSKYYESLITKLKQSKKIEIKAHPEEVQNLQKRIEHFQAAQDSLLTQVKRKDEEVKGLQRQVNEYIKLCEKYEKELASEKARREKLGTNNKSLGAYKGLYNREKKKTDELKHEIQSLREKIASLERQLEV